VTIIFYTDAKINGKSGKGKKENVNQDTGINHTSELLMLDNVKILLFE